MTSEELEVTLSTSLRALRMGVKSVCKALCAALVSTVLPGRAWKACRSLILCPITIASKMRAAWLICPGVAP
jgi:hypothetical protein